MINYAAVAGNVIAVREDESVEDFKARAIEAAKELGSGSVIFADNIVDVVFVEPAEDETVDSVL